MKICDSCHLEVRGGVTYTCKSCNAKNCRHCAYYDPKYDSHYCDRGYSCEARVRKAERESK